MARAETWFRPSSASQHTNLTEFMLSVQTAIESNVYCPTPLPQRKCCGLSFTPDPSNGFVSLWYSSKLLVLFPSKAANQLPGCCMWQQNSATVTGTHAASWLHYHVFEVVAATQPLIWYHDTSPIVTVLTNTVKDLTVVSRYQPNGGGCSITKIKPHQQEFQWAPDTAGRSANTDLHIPRWCLLE